MFEDISQVKAHLSMVAEHENQENFAYALWREGGDAPARDVVLVVQGRSLVLLDPRSEIALAHWALDALVRRKSANDVVVLAPSEQEDESLELIPGSISVRLTGLIDRMSQSRPKPGRLRGYVVGAVTAAIVGLGLFAGPAILTAHTASVVPPSVRRDIGALAFMDLARLTGSSCATELGLEATKVLMRRLFAKEQARLLVVRSTANAIITLPGPLFVVNQNLLEKSIGPEAFAGFLLAEFAKIPTQDPLEELLHYAGVLPSFKLLTTSKLPPKSVWGYGEVVLRTPHPKVEDAALIALFKNAEISTAPYAQAQEEAGQTALYLRSYDPFPEGSGRTILSDGEWISLQDICAE